MVHGLCVLTFSVEVHVLLKLIKILFQKMHSLLTALRKIDYEGLN